MAPLMAKEPNCGALKAERLLLNEPIGVRAAETIITSSPEKLFVEVDNVFAIGGHSLTPLYGLLPTFRRLIVLIVLNIWSQSLTIFELTNFFESNADFKSTH